VLVAEDDTFYQHSAIDLKGLEEAIRADWERKQLTRGGSTITRQLLMRSKYLSGFVRFLARTRAATASDASKFRKVVCWQHHDSLDVLSF